MFHSFPAFLMETPQLPFRTSTLHARRRPSNMARGELTVRRARDHAGAAIFMRSTPGCGTSADPSLELVSESFFSRYLSLFSGDFTYVHWNIPTYSPIRIFIFGRRYVPILKTFLQFFKNRSFRGVEPPEGLEIVPDILTQFFSKSEF